MSDTKRTNLKLVYIQYQQMCILQIRCIHYLVMLFVFVQFGSWYGKQREMFSITTKVCSVRVRNLRACDITCEQLVYNMVVGVCGMYLTTYTVIMKFQNFIINFIFRFNLYTFLVIIKLNKSVFLTGLDSSLLLVERYIIQCHITDKFQNFKYFLYKYDRYYV